MKDLPRAAERDRTAAAPRVRRRPLRFVIELVRACVADRLDDVGAMMTFYAVLALFPMLIFVLTLATLVLPATAIDEGVMMATQAMPAATRELVVAYVDRFVATAGPHFAIGSALFALWSASRGTDALARALNAMLGVEETRPWWRRQATSIGLTLAVAAIVIAALGLLVLGPAAGHFVADRFGLGAAFDVAWGVARWIGAGALMMFVWALVYRYLPNARASIHVFTVGAVAGVVLWLAVSYAFGIYLAHFASYETTYGALGGIIIFLTWLWITSMAILLGAEINQTLARRRRAR